MRVPTRLPRVPREYERSLGRHAQVRSDETFRHGMDSFADQDSVAIAAEVYRPVPDYNPRAKAEELARAGNTIDVWAQIGVAQLRGDSGATEEWAHETAASAHEQAARHWREHASREESLVGREVDEREAGYHEFAAHAIRERR